MGADLSPAIDISQNRGLLLQVWSRIRLFSNHDWSIAIVPFAGRTFLFKEGFWNQPIGTDVTASYKFLENHRFHFSIGSVYNTVRYHEDSAVALENQIWTDASITAAVNYEWRITSHHSAIAFIMPYINTSKNSGGSFYKPGSNMGGSEGLLFNYDSYPRKTKVGMTPGLGYQYQGDRFGIMLGGGIGPGTGYTDWHWASSIEARL